MTTPSEQLKIQEIIGFLCHQYPALNFHICCTARRELTNDEKITILTEDLGKRKIFACFVPHQLNAPPQKTKKVNEFLMKNRFVSWTTLRIRLIYHRVTIFCSQN